MTRLISIITPVHEPNLPFLEEAYHSILGQALPGGWAWQWVIQADGEHLAIPETITSDQRVSLGAIPIGGPGVARSSALIRAEGELIRNLDSDDAFLPGALARDIEVLATDDSIGWVTSRALDLLPDGTTTEYTFGEPPTGTIPRGWVLKTWRSQNWRLPILPGTMCIRRPLLIALGGWMALPSSEDTGVIVAASVVSDGHFIGEPSILYRKHPAQTTAQDHHLDPTGAQLRRRLIVERAEALAALSPGGWQPNAS
jgi:Glycosyl transferase family 2